MLLLSMDKMDEKVHLFLSVSGNEIMNVLLHDNGARLMELLAQFHDRIGDICHEFIEFVGNPNEYYLTTDANIVEMKRLIAFCNARIKPEYTAGQQFIFPLSTVLQTDKITTAIKDIEIDAVFASNQMDQDAIYDRESWRGLWTEDMGYQNRLGERKTLHIGRLAIGRVVANDLNTIMTTYSASKFEALENILNTIRETVRHETEHMLQTFIGFITGSRAGLPSNRIRERQYGEYGFNPANQQNQMLEHSLRDIEFYTNLGDSVSAYKRVIGSVPLYLRDSFLRSWIALDPMLQANRTIIMMTNREGRQTTSQQHNAIHEALRSLSAHRALFEQLKGHQRSLEHAKSWRQTTEPKIYGGSSRVYQSGKLINMCA